MRGLPFSACSSDVISFFQAVPTLDRERIYFAYDGTGRPSGEAYAVFMGTDGFNAAMKLHKHKMGPRYIELFASSSSELQRLAKQKKLRADTGQGRTRALVATKDVELKSVAAPRMSAVRGEHTQLTAQQCACACVLPCACVSSCRLEVLNTDWHCQHTPEVRPQPCTV